MKLLDLRRLNVGLALRVIFAYICSKVLRMSVMKDQNQMIAYFNHLGKLNLWHEKSFTNHFLVNSRKFGRFYLRRPFSSDYKVYEQVFLDQEYLLLAQLIEKNCDGESISMIDGGANIGFTSIYICDYFKNKKEIRSILVEPFDDNIETAKLNVMVHDISTISIEKAGLHNKKCYLKTDQQFRDGMEWSVQIVETEEETNLQSIEINEILERYKIEKLDVLKLDIEGAERFLFQDEHYSSDFLKRVNIIAIELHDEYFEANSILDIIRRNNFELSKFGEMYVGAKKEFSRN